MLEVVPYQLEEIKNELKRKAIDEFGLVDAQFEGSNVSQLINLLAYSTLIKNTNLTFGLNEMFITQAQDRQNVIKHARQMGYVNKRKTSFQYKIKLKVLDTGNIILDKYTKFESPENTYVYLGDSVSDVYGFYIHLMLLLNENNNNLESIYSNPSELLVNNFVISEEGQVSRILDKTTVGNPRLLLETLDKKPVLEYSSLPKSMYIWDGTRSSTTGYRNFTKIGTIDTFLYEEAFETFKIQLTLDNSIIFPVFTQDSLTSLIQNFNNEFTVYDNTAYPIKTVDSMIVNGTTNVDVSTLIYNEGDYTVSFPKDKIGISEKHTDAVTQTDKSALVSTYNDIIEDSFRSIDIEIGNSVRSISADLIGINGRELSIPAQVTDTKESLVIAGSTITLHKTPKTVSSITVIQNGSEITLTNFSVLANVITLLDSSNNPDEQYNSLTSVVEYNFYEDMSLLAMYINYSYIIDLTNLSVDMIYSYDMGNDGYLDKRFFIEDLRGEVLDNEYPSDERALGFDGFYASSYDRETNVLLFDVSNNNNKYASTIQNGVLTEGEQIHKVLTTPFKRTRFSPTKANYSPLGDLIDYDSFNGDLAFGSVKSIDVKDELEIIVKEGNLLKWDDQTDESYALRLEALQNGTPIPDPVYLYDDLIIDINENMVNARKFIINKTDVENNGIELFVTRILPNGTIEYDIPWEQRTYLLSESEDNSSIVPTRNFVVLENENYSDYLDIYTMFANSGIALSLDFIVKLNLLISKGALGSTNELIKPINTDMFEAMYYNEETLTPHVLYAEGSNDESVDSIRESASLYSNTANRAVTEKDYVTICNSQGFIQSSRVWGGEEEVPTKKLGHIFFSLVPYSRPVGFVKTDNTFNLNKYELSSLFFPSYYQITGKSNYYSNRDESDRSVLFNILNQYKIITLQLNYKKVVYLDYVVDIEILKYKTAQTVSDTHDQVFAELRSFFVSNIEKFESIFYKSSLIKHLNAVLGTDYGLELTTKNTVEMYDNLLTPEDGTFVNSTMSDITPDVNGISGAYDIWSFDMQLVADYTDLFEPDIIIDYRLIEKGAIKTDSIINCSTDNFLIYGDSLYMDLNVNAIRAIDIDGYETFGEPSRGSSTIEINIMYKRSATSEAFKVGSYTMYRNKEVALIRINTALYENINNDVYLDTRPLVEYGTKEDNTPNTFKIAPLPRSEFIDVKRKLEIKSNNSTITTTRNTFSRLTQVNFI
ncbi:MAG: hypothetical protein ACYDD5_00195 [Sulfuricurvum sp.]